jgi:hypothetical protein
MPETPQRKARREIDADLAADRDEIDFTARRGVALRDCASAFLPAAAIRSRARPGRLRDDFQIRQAHAAGHGTVLRRKRKDHIALSVTASLSTNHDRTYRRREEEVGNADEAGKGARTGSA